jgi:DNA-binding HxlR family transcriptional regulator
MNTEIKIMDVKGCPIEQTVVILEGKWTVLILCELFTGTKRFGELRNGLTGISPKILSKRLRILEKQGIIERTVYSETPPRVEYSLTKLGKSLNPIIESLREWGTQWANLVLSGAG